MNADAAEGTEGRAAQAPSPSELRTRLVAVRDAAAALRRRPARHTIDSLGRLLEGWRAPSSPWREALARALPAATGFSEAMVREGLARGLAPFSAASLEALISLELGAPEGRAAPRAVLPFPTTAVLLAGALPTPTFPALLAPLLLRSGVVAKTSAHDPLTACHLAASLAQVDAELAACLAVVSFPGSDAARTEALLEADCIVATGSDETVASVCARVRPPRRAVVHGHRMSVAAVGPDATRGRALSEAADALALDVAMWDQLGCLSPLAVFVDASDPDAPDRVAEALAGALADAEARWPRGRVDPAAAALAAHERAEAEMRAAAGHRVRLLAPRDARFTVVREEDARWRPAPLHRFVRVQPVDGAAGLLAALAPLAAHLAAVACCGWREDDLGARLLASGASRVCPPGQLQSPPLHWPRDGIGVVVPLARLASSELA